MRQREDRCKIKDVLKCDAFVFPEDGHVLSFTSREKRQ